MAIYRKKPRPEPEAIDRARELRHQSTGPERRLWHLLRNRRLEGLKFRRQVPIGPDIADYYCAEVQLIVELDGESHVGRAEYDDKRTAFLEHKGLRVLRITNDDVLQYEEAVAEAILRAAGDRG